MKLRIADQPAPAVAARFRALATGLASGGWWSCVLDGRHAISSSGLNAALRETTVGCSLIGEWEHPLGTEFTDSVVEATAQGSLLFDAPKLRLASPLSPKLLGDGQWVSLELTSYFQTVASNDLTARSVTRQHDGRSVYDGWSWFSQGHELLSVGSTSNSDHVGGQTLVITRDRKLLITRQGARSAQSAGLWAPSGSGSLDADDLAGAKSFAQLLTRGIERELAEECGVSTEALTTRLTGFARMLHRGGKPEFFALTFLDSDAAEAKISLQEHETVAEIRTLDLHPDDVELATDLDTYAATLEDQSILLHLALKLAAVELRLEAMERDMSKAQSSQR